MKNLLKDKVIIDNDKLTSRYTFMKDELPKGGKSELIYVKNPKHGVGKIKQDKYIMYLITDSGKEVRFGTIPSLGVSKGMQEFVAESLNEAKGDKYKYYNMVDKAMRGENFFSDVSKLIKKVSKELGLDSSVYFDKKRGVIDYQKFIDDATEKEMSESLNEAKFDIILDGIEIPFSIKDKYQLAYVYSFDDLSDDEKAMLIAKQYEEEGGFHTDFTIISNRFGELFAVELDSRNVKSFIEDFEDNLVNGFDNTDSILDFLITISDNDFVYELDAKVIDSKYPFHIVDVESYNGKVLVGYSLDLQEYILEEILSEDHMPLNALFEEVDLRYSDYVDMNSLEELAEREVESRFNEFVATGDIFYILEQEIEELMDDYGLDIDMADVTWIDLKEIHDEIEEAYSEYYMNSEMLEEFYDMTFESGDLKNIVDWEGLLEDEDMFNAIVSIIADSDVADDWRRTDLIAFYQP